MDWKLFSEETPEEGKIIAYGNHRFIYTGRYSKANEIESKIISYKPVTHWSYVEMPPCTTVSKHEWKE